MAPGPIRFSAALALVVVLPFPLALNADRHGGIEYEFTQAELHYAFRGSFAVTGDDDCLLEVVYGFRHISKYAAGAESLTKGRQGEGWYEVTYTYRRFIVFKNRSTWRRTLNKAGQRVEFEMTESENNLGVMPEVLSSSGYYQLQKDGDGRRLVYFQECAISDGAFSKTYMRRARKEAIRFLEEFRHYVNSTCK